MTTTTSILWALIVFVAIEGKGAAEALSNGDDLAVVCEFQEIGAPDEGGRYWPSGEIKPLVLRFESDDFFRSKVLELTDPENIIGPIVARHKTVSDKGTEWINFTGSNDRQFNFSPGSLAVNATILDGEGQLLLSGMCVSSWYLKRVIANAKSGMSQ